jgi:hypothetical protein
MAHMCLSEENHPTYQKAMFGRSLCNTYTQSKEESCRTMHSCLGYTSFPEAFFETLLY